MRRGSRIGRDTAGARRGLAPRPPLHRASRQARSLTAAPAGPSRRAAGPRAWRPASTGARTTQRSRGVEIVRRRPGATARAREVTGQSQAQCGCCQSGGFAETGAWAACAPLFGAGDPRFRAPRKRTRLRCGGDESSSPKKGSLTLSEAVLGNKRHRDQGRQHAPPAAPDRASASIRDQPWRPKGSWAMAGAGGAESGTAGIASDADVGGPRFRGAPTSPPPEFRLADTWSGAPL